MSSLAEINKSLIQQNKEQERTSTAIEDVRAKISRQLQLAELGSFRDAENKREAKAAMRSRPQGFVQGLSEGTGLAGLGRFGQGIIGALFGGLSGGAIAGLAGNVAGKLLKGTLLAGLVTTFGEDAIKGLFNKLKEQGIDFNFTAEQEDEIAKRTTDGLFGAIIAGIIFKNPLVRLGAFIVTAFKDKIFSGLEAVLGIKITDMGGKDGVAVTIPWMDDKVFKFDENWTNGILGVVGGFFVYLTGKILKGVKNLIFNGQTKLDKKIANMLEENQKKLNKLEADLEAEKAKKTSRQTRAKYSTSRTSAAQNAIELQRAQQARLMQNINARYQPVSAMMTSPGQPSLAAQAIDELSGYNAKAINDVGFERIVAKDGRVLFQNSATKVFESPNIVLESVKANAKPKGRFAKGLKAVGRVGGKYIPPVAAGVAVYEGATDEELAAKGANVFERTQTALETGTLATFDLLANGLGMGINYALQKAGSDVRVKTDQDLAGLHRGAVKRRLDFEADIGYRQPAQPSNFFNAPQQTTVNNTQSTRVQLSNSFPAATDNNWMRQYMGAGQ